MLTRVLTIALNTYREAVRARLLHGLMAFALSTCVYAVFVASLSVEQQPRVLANIGAASISLYAVLVAIVLGATSLHREVELKTVFPILSRPISRTEYIVGKFVGTVLTLAVFVAIDAACVLLLLASKTGHARIAGGIAIGSLVAFGLIVWRVRYTRVFVAIPWSLGLFIAAYWASSSAGLERQLVTASSALAVSEVAIVSAIAIFFASFSSPFLTAVLTLGLFLIGRTADTLGSLPVRVVGSAARSIGLVLTKIVPNLHLYVPARALLLGQVPGTKPWVYVGTATLQSMAYVVLLLAVSAAIFRRRDFQ